MIPDSYIRSWRISVPSILQHNKQYAALNMTSKIVLIAFLAQIALVLSQGYNYDVPRPKIKALNTGGIYMSIPHRAGIEQVTFHANVNKPLDGDLGQINQKVTDRWNGKWSFLDRTVRLNGGDKVYFSISVKKDGKEHRYEDGRFLVTEDAFSSEEGHSSASSEERYRRY